LGILIKHQPPMKNITLLIALLFAFIANAQNFPYKRPELLLGKELKVTNLKKYQLQDGLEWFYNSANRARPYAVNANYKSTADSLVNRVFKVISVTPDNSFGRKDYILKLEDANKKTVYYWYKFDQPAAFVFEVIGGLNAPADFYYDYIIEKKIGGLRVLMTEPYTEYMYISKFVEAPSFYSLSIRTGYDVAPPYKPITILLANNKTITRPAKNVKPYEHRGSNSGVYADIALTPAEVELLKANEIVSYTISGQKEDASYITAPIIKGVLNCMDAKK